MDNNQLAYSRSINAMRIFLNILGYTLDDEYDSNAIKIKNKDMKVVGKLCIDNNAVVVKIKDKYLSVAARCAVSESLDFSVHKIIYGVKVKKTSILNTMNGTFILTTTDSKNCTCNANIVCTAPDIDKVNIEVSNDGKILGIYIDSLNYREKIEVNNDYSGCIKHGITRASVSKDNCEHTYRLHAGIFNGQQFSKHGDKLHAVVLETLDDNTIRNKEDYVDKALSTSELLLQKGALMRRLDYTMIAGIQHIRGLLSINNIKILDNMISVCCEEYSDDELQALLGIKKSDSIYQNGASSLREAYFDNKEVLVRRRTNK